MLDFRLQTFLALCRIGSYTKTAQALHLTQPAVTQHVQYLERHYGCRLFVYEDKRLRLTEHGRLLRDMAGAMAADGDHLHTMMAQPLLGTHPVVFGATLSIGEYVMPPILAQLIARYPDTHFNMSVSNTQVLLERLRAGGIAFALLEGFFDKSEYSARLLGLAPFVAVCAPSSPLACGTHTLASLCGTRLILREKGSGTREILEHMLQAHNMTAGSFAQMIEIGNMSAIKQLVAEGLGITFLYRAAAQRELAAGTLCEMRIEGMEASREFNFVYLKDSLHAQEYLGWFAQMHALYAAGAQ